MFTDNQIEEIINLLISLDENTKVYLGCDSIRFKENGLIYAKYATVCIIHKNGKNGCRLFSHKSIELDYDVKKNRPKLRMLNEARKVCELYQQLIPFIDGFPIEIHLDISSLPTAGSNCAASEAAGYILSYTGITPKLKPESQMASIGADGAVRGKGVKM